MRLFNDMPVPDTTQEPARRLRAYVALFVARLRLTNRLSLACATLVLFFSGASEAPGADNPKSDKPFDAAVAQKLATVKRWRGFYEVHVNGNPSRPVPSMRVNRGSEDTSSYGSFELTRDNADDGWWDPSRGLFQWRGDGELRASHHVSTESWSNDGSGDQVAEDSKANLPLRNVHIWINLGARSAGFHNGDDITRMPATRRGFALQRRYDHPQQAFVFDRISLDGEVEHGPTLPTLSRTINRVITPVDFFPQVAGGPGQIAVNTSDEVAGYSLRFPGPMHVTEQLLLFPIYDNIDCEVTIEGYADWLPRGSIADPKKPGNALVARAVLKAKDGKTKELPQVELFRFELINTSREPGICLNWPLKAEDTDFDLRLADFKNGSEADPLGAMKKFLSDWGMSSSGDFDAASLPGRGMPQWRFPEVSEDGQKGELPDPPKDKSGQPFAEAAIECFDFGAKSELRVTCVLKDGREIVGLMKGKDGGQELVRLPKRNGSDWVAEKWLKENDATNLSANDDDEKVDGQKDNGDGFTLYEEYRGWVENGKHITGDPKRKDFFVLNAIGPAAKGGIALFERVSKLLVHSKLRRTEIVVLPVTQIESVSNAKGERIMNLNHRDAPHRVDQHAVHMINTSGFRSGGGGTDGVINGDKTSYAFRPGKVQLVHVEEAGIFDGIFSKDRSTTLYNLNERDAAFAYDRGVAHELLHSVGVDHHGEGEERRAFYFQSASDPNNPTRRARFTLKLPWILDTELENKWFGGTPVTAQVLERPTTITLIWEDTGRDVAESLAADFEQTLAATRANIAANPPAEDAGTRATRFPQLGKDAHYWRETEIFDYTVNNHEQFKVYATIGKMGQADSGNELCLMRYYFANAYPVPGRENTYYLVRPGPDANRAGRELCKSPAGTGQNAPDHKPMSRFGDSAPGRGGCFQYVCPNDAIPPRTL